MKIMFLHLFFFLFSCSITRPCREGGDVSWPHRFNGDQTCFQVKDKTGKMINHGEYRHYNESKKIILEGMFVRGKKNGVWIEKNEDGKKVLEKTYENGVEVGSKTYLPDSSSRK